MEILWPHPKKKWGVKGPAICEAHWGLYSGRKTKTTVILNDYIRLVSCGKPDLQIYLIKMTYSTKYKISYLAPEINGISSTFVYNEILSMEERGFEVTPISVHLPGAIEEGKKLEGINKKVTYLYQKSLISIIADNIRIILIKPKGYFSTLLMAVSDSLKVGITTRVGRGLLYRFLIASIASRILLKNQCQHLHSHFAHISTDIAMYASKISGISFSFTSHANDLVERGWLLKEKIDRANISITISDYNRNFLVRNFGMGEKIKVVRCGVETNGFTSKRNQPNTPPLIGSLGRLVEKKGMDVLISAMGKLESMGYHFKLEIAGDGPLMIQLKDLSIEENINSKINFKGAIPHEDVYNWLKKLDLFVLASKKDSNGDQDGIPVVLMEAMALGIPVVSTSISAIPELIEDGVSGLLADPGDVESLSEKLKIALSEPSVINNFTEKAFAYLKKEFDMNLNADRLKNIFEVILNEKK